MDEPERPLTTVRAAVATIDVPAGGAGTIGDCPSSSHRTRRHLTETVSVTACDGCGGMDWFRDEAPMPSYEGVAEVFGSFDLVGTLPAIHAPGVEVLVYSPPDSTSRQALDALPSRRWWDAAPGLSLSHDRRLLLVAPATEVAGLLGQV